MKLSVRVFGMLSRILLPGAFTTRYGEELVETYARGHEDARRRSLRAAFWFTMRELCALTVTAVAERRAATAPAPQTPARGRGVMWNVMHDVGFALRITRRSPLYAGVIALTLAAGIGINLAVWTVLNAVLLRSLPYADAHELVQIWNRMTTPAVDDMTVAPADYLDYRARARTFEDIAAHNLWFPTVGDAANADRVLAGMVTPNFFPLLGIEPALGRGFSTSENIRAGARVVLLSHGGWQRWFGGDASVVGRTFVIGTSSYEVIGVLPEDYRHPDPHEPLREASFFVPFDFTSGEQRASQSLRVVGRLREGVSLGAARMELMRIAAELEHAHPDTNRGRGANVLSLRDQFFGATRAPLALALGAAVLVLLIAAANIANLVLVRSHGRQREFAIRVSLGASRGRVARQLLVENVLLSALGAGLALVCLQASLGALRALRGRLLPVLADIRVDGSAVAVALVLTFLTGIGFALAPLLAERRTALRDMLAYASAGSGTSARVHRVRQALVIGQVALAVSLVAATGVLARSYANLRAMSPGFEPADVLAFNLSLRTDRYAAASARLAFYRELLERVRAVAGVSGVALNSDLPLTDENRSIELRPTTAAPGNEVLTDFQIVSPGYFDVMRMRLLSGSVFSEGAGPDVAIVTEELARRFWPGQDAVGKQLSLQNGTRLTVIGTASDVLDRGLNAPPEPLVYLPLVAQPSRGVTVVARTAVDPMAVVPEIRRTVYSMDASIPVVEVRTLESIVRQHLVRPRLASDTAIGFSLLALALACVGLYGVLSYIVSARTREIGIRAALGADAGAVARMLALQTFRLLVPGLALGVVLGLAFTRLLAGFVFGVNAADPLSFATACVVLVSVGVVATLIPTRRALRISPMQALRP